VECQQKPICAYETYRTSHLRWAPRVRAGHSRSCRLGVASRFSLIASGPVADFDHLVTRSAPRIQIPHSLSFTAEIHDPRFIFIFRFCLMTSVDVEKCKSHEHESAVCLICKISLHVLFKCEKLTNDFSLMQVQLSFLKFLNLMI
jgi:hypothetical protein